MELAQEIDNYLTAVLIRYFRDSSAEANVEHPEIDLDRDIEVLRIHWAISSSVLELINHLRRNAHEIQAVLDTRIAEDDARVRGRYDARATEHKRMVSGHPTVMVSHEPRRTYDSGPNHVLTWVLEQSWRMVIHIRDKIPEEAPISKRTQECATGLERIRRFDSIRQASKQLDLSKRPGHQAAKEALRSRRRIYSLAGKAYMALLAIEAGVKDSIKTLLQDTLMGPLEVWQRFELAVALAMTKALSEEIGKPMRLEYMFDLSGTLARISDYEIRSQTHINKDMWVSQQEPSEALVSSLLKQYGLHEGFDRPDLVLYKCNGNTEQVVAVTEVKYFSDKKYDGYHSLRAALSQLVRYCRVFREFEDINNLLDHSIIALARAENRLKVGPKPYGLPHVFDFADMQSNRLTEWAKRCIQTN